MSSCFFFVFLINHNSFFPFSLFLFRISFCSILTPQNFKYVIQVASCCFILVHAFITNLNSKPFLFVYSLYLLAPFVPHPAGSHRRQRAAAHRLLCSAPSVPRARFDHVWVPCAQAGLDAGCGGAGGCIIPREPPQRHRTQRGRHATAKKHKQSLNAPRDHCDFPSVRYDCNDFTLAW
jgi:hypothetical protein